MFENLIEVKNKYNDLTLKIADPEVIADRNMWQKLVKEHASLTELVEEYDNFIAITRDIEDCNLALESGDEDLIEFAKEEMPALKERLEQSIQKIKILLLPKDPNDDKNVIVEIRAGAGGEEACLFAGRLVRMYRMYAEKMHWTIEEISANVTELGGVKEMSFAINGEGAYSKLKYESGVHRVQRVPETESQGRIHTSTATVAVLPEVEDVQIEILEKDLKIDTYRSGGAGGQHVNKTESAIRITHLPTGIVVTCEDERSQIKNRDKAMRVLKSRLYDYYQSQLEKDYADQRRSQVGTGDRSERIRTYNFPQGRITDHRIGFTAYNLLEFLDGDIYEMVEALRIYDQNAKLEMSLNSND
ncbi:MAG: peptide chain release factor 1 [Clostridia bacterium]|nr:peptide chain release factor 1 [Clostridia bacterium]